MVAWVDVCGNVERVRGVGREGEGIQEREDRGEVGVGVPVRLRMW